MAIQARVTSRGQPAPTIEELGALDLFHGLPLHDLEGIQDIGNCLLFGRGETIVAITRGTVMAYVLLEGCASAYRFGPTGLKLEIERLSPGHLYLPAFQDHESNQQDVIEAVYAETRVLRLPAATIHVLIASRCSVGAAVSAQASDSGRHWRSGSKMLAFPFECDCAGNLCEESDTTRATCSPRPRKSGAGVSTVSAKRRTGRLGCWHGIEQSSSNTRHGESSCSTLCG